MQHSNNNLKYIQFKVCTIQYRRLIKGYAIKEHRTVLFSHNTIMLILMAAGGGYGILKVDHYLFLVPSRVLFGRG